MNNTYERNSVRDLDRNSNENNAITNADNIEVYRATDRLVNDLDTSRMMIENDEFGNEYIDRAASQKAHDEIIDGFYDQTIRPSIRNIFKKAINIHKRNSGALREIDERIAKIEATKDSYTEDYHNGNMKPSKWSQWLDNDNREINELARQREWLSQLYDDNNYDSEAQMSQVGRLYEEVALPSKEAKTNEFRSRLEQMEADLGSYN